MLLAVRSQSRVNLIWIRIGLIILCRSLIYRLRKGWFV